MYFPELRPFFLENANYFTTLSPIALLYTRNIVHPEYGARLTGKLGHTNLGLLAIDDREPGETVSTGDPLYKKRAYITVGRVSQDFGKGSSIAALYTDYEFGQGWNRVGGVDSAVRFNNKWTAVGQWVESSTMGTVDSAPPTYSAGPTWNAECEPLRALFQSQFESFGFQHRLSNVVGIYSDIEHSQRPYLLKLSVVSEA